MKNKETSLSSVSIPLIGPLKAGLFWSTSRIPNITCDIFADSSVAQSWEDMDAWTIGWVAVKNI